MKAVKDCMLRFPDPKRPDKYILKLLEINLTKNDFEFDSKFHLQIKGTAMGKKFAPSYANIFMASWEQRALASFHLKPFAYFRFVDDIWGIWTHGMEEFRKCTHHLNHQQKSIKITFETNSLEVNFLDVVTYKGPNFSETGHLDYKVFFKPTDTHCLLHRDSFHPSHPFRGIFKSQLLRFHRICSQETEFRKAVKILFKTLKKRRKYSRGYLRRAIRSFNQSVTNPVKITQERNKIVPLVSFFHNTVLNSFTQIMAARMVAAANGSPFQCIFLFLVFFFTLCVIGTAYIQYTRQTLLDIGDQHKYLFRATFTTPITSQTT